MSIASLRNQSANFLAELSESNRKLSSLYLDGNKENLKTLNKKEDRGKKSSNAKSRLSNVVSKKKDKNDAIAKEQNKEASYDTYPRIGTWKISDRGNNELNQSSNLNKSEYFDKYTPWDVQKISKVEPKLESFNISQNIDFVDCVSEHTDKFRQSLDDMGKPRLQKSNKSNPSDIIIKDYNEKINSEYNDEFTKKDSITNQNVAGMKNVVKNDFYDTISQSQMGLKGISKSEYDDIYSKKIKIADIAPIAGKSSNISDDIKQTLSNNINETPKSEYNYNYIKREQGVKTPICKPSPSEDSVANLLSETKNQIDNLINEYAKEYRKLAHPQIQYNIQPTNESNFNLFDQNIDKENWQSEYHKMFDEKPIDLARTLSSPIIIRSGNNDISNVLGSSLQYDSNVLESEYRKHFIKHDIDSQPAASYDTQKFKSSIYETTEINPIFLSEYDENFQRYDITDSNSYQIAGKVSSKSLGVNDILKFNNIDNSKLISEYDDKFHQKDANVIQTHDVIHPPFDSQMKDLLFPDNYDLSETEYREHFVKAQQNIDEVAGKPTKSSNPLTIFASSDKANANQISEYQSKFVNAPIEHEMPKNLTNRGDNLLATLFPSENPISNDVFWKTVYQENFIASQSQDLPVVAGKPSPQKAYSSKELLDYDRVTLQSEYKDQFIPHEIQPTPEKSTSKSSTISISSANPTQVVDWQSEYDQNFIVPSSSAESINVANPTNPSSDNIPTNFAWIKSDGDVALSSEYCDSFKYDPSVIQTSNSSRFQSKNFSQLPLSGSASDWQSEYDQRCQELRQQMADLNHLRTTHAAGFPSIVDTYRPTNFAWNEVSQNESNESSIVATKLESNTEYKDNFQAVDPFAISGRIISKVPAASASKALELIQAKDCEFNGVNQSEYQDQFSTTKSSPLNIPAYPAIPIDMTKGSSISDANTTGNISVDSLNQQPTMISKTKKTLKTSVIQSASNKRRFSTEYNEKFKPPIVKQYVKHPMTVDVESGVSMMKSIPSNVSKGSQVNSESQSKYDWAADAMKIRNSLNSKYSDKYRRSDSTAPVARLLPKNSKFIVKTEESNVERSNSAPAAKFSKSKLGGNPIYSNPRLAKGSISRTSHWTTETKSSFIWKK